jgi:hypothetical protein
MCQVRYSSWKRPPTSSIEPQTSLHKTTLKSFSNPRTEPIMRLENNPYHLACLYTGQSPYGSAGKLRKSHQVKSISCSATSAAHSLLRTPRRECQSPLAVLPPEAHHQPDKPISFPADIWTLACALWEIFSSRALTLRLQQGMISLHSR